MYKLLGGLKDYFKAQEVQIDNAVFRLHNVFTTVLLLACSLVITATQYVGQPISCIVNGIPPHVVNTYCWISSTFTMPDAFQRQVKITFYFILWIFIRSLLSWVKSASSSAHLNRGKQRFGWRAPTATNDTYFCYTHKMILRLYFVCVFDESSQ